MAETVVRRRAIVSGHVQGVGFRWGVRARAQELRLGGVARNRADGTVEVEAEGERSAVDELMAWLRTGPPGAAVTDVEVTEIAASALPGTVRRRFEIR